MRGNAWKTRQEEQDGYSPGNSVRQYYSGGSDVVRGPGEISDNNLPLQDGYETVDPAMKDDSQLGVALLHALRNAGVSVLYQDSELRTVWARNMAAPWAIPGDRGEKTILPPAQLERIMAARRAAITLGRADRFEISAPGENDTRWFEVWVDPDFSDDGTVRGVITTKVETTERKHREQSLRALLREVSHRSKNLLAIIQSLASQTGRYSSSIGEFLTFFHGRLQSLASSQDLITSSNWRGALLRDLVHGQLDRYIDGDRDRLQFEGANPYLNPNAALHIGLALHELTVNSRSRGALSRNRGTIAISSVLAGDKDQAKTLHVSWREPFAVGDSQFASRNFSLVTLERVVPTSLSGRAELKVANDVLEYRLAVPHRNFEEEDESGASGA